MLLVSTFSDGLEFTPGLRIGDNGFAMGSEASSFIFEDSREPGEGPCSGRYDGPVTHCMRASPKGPALQLVPGALLDRS